MNRSMFSFLLLLAGVVCFVIAWAISIQFVFDYGNYPAWIAGGLALAFGSFLSDRWPARA